METLCFYLLALLELLSHRSAMGPKKGISAKPSSVQLDAENENRDNKFSLNQLHSPWEISDKDVYPSIEWSIHLFNL